MPTGGPVIMPHRVYASYEVDLWPPRPQSWHFVLLLCGPFVPSAWMGIEIGSFIFQNIVFSSFVTDGRTNGRVENMMLPTASLIWRQGRSQDFHSYGISLPSPFLPLPSPPSALPLLPLPSPSCSSISPFHSFLPMIHLGGLGERCKLPLQQVRAESRPTNDFFGEFRA